MPLADLEELNAPTTAWGRAEIWDGEYRDFKSIPSSYRMTPSRALGALFPVLQVTAGHRALDAGAGTGRHSLYLAARGIDVDAVDVSGEACAVLESRRAALSGSHGRIAVERVALGVGDASHVDYDLAIDSYVSCHLLSAEARVEYLRGLLNSVRRGGRLYTAVMGAGDEFYRIHRSHWSESGLSTDPANGITKRLMTRNMFVEELSEVGTVEVGTVVRFTDLVDGQPFEREVYAAVIRRS